MAAIVYSATGNFSDVEFDATLSVIEFDATLSENHNVSAASTDHPVEKGVDVSDHVHVQKETVSLECIVTNTPLKDMTTPIISTKLLPQAKSLIAAAPLKMAPQPITLDGQTSRQTQTAVVEPPSVFGWRNFLVRVPTKPAKLKQPSAFDKHVPNSVNGVSLQAVEQGDRVRAVYELLRDLCRAGVEVMLVTDVRDYDSMLIKSVSAPKTAMDAIIFSMELEEVRFSETKIVEMRIKKTLEKRAQTFEPVGQAAGYAPPEEDEDIKKSYIDRIVLTAAESTQ